MKTSSFWQLRWDRGSTVRVGGLLVLLLLLGGYWLFPRIPRNSARPPNNIANNLRILEGAKEQWALEHHATNGALPTAADLAPYLKDGKRTLEAALDRWYQKHGQTGPPPTPDELAPYLKLDELIKPVAGEIYTIKPVGELNTLTIPKTLKGRFKAGEVFTVTSF